MANQPDIELSFKSSCGDCGLRSARLPLPLPPLGDDFDWLTRDYDGFRLFMMEELAARFPDRRRWTPADMEVVIVEALSVVLDQHSDNLDRAQSEAFLDTARRPESVQRLLSFIGYNAVAQADAKANIPDASPALSETDNQLRQRLKGFHHGLDYYLSTSSPIYPSFFAPLLNQLSPAQLAGVMTFIDDPDSAPVSALNATQFFIDRAPSLVEQIKNDALRRYWTLFPTAMERARESGPRSIHTQKRMVTQDDYGQQLQQHPLVLFANASEYWSGSWATIETAVLLFNTLKLDEEISEASVGGAQSLAALQSAIDDFHKSHELAEIDWASGVTARRILRSYIDYYRMAGQEVFLADATVVGINISLSLRISRHYFQSEVRQAVTQALGNELGGFFEPGQQGFGEDLHSSDIIEVVAALDGVEAVCLNRFKRVGKRYADQSDRGQIAINGVEVAVCDNNSQTPERGILRLVLHGGQQG